MTLLRVVLAVVMAACGGSQSAVRLPTDEELKQACPGSFEAATLGCGAIAVKHCDGYDSLAECPNGEAARTECRELRQKEYAQCR